MVDAGNWMLDDRCWVLDAGCIPFLEFEFMCSGKVAQNNTEQGTPNAELRRPPPLEA